jgi:uncharacterized membrane protein YeaQ/YmgE (transglycosylase-associated protein family)
MDPNTIIVLIVVGAIAGWLANALIGGLRGGLLGTIVAGILGAFVGNWLLPLLGISINIGGPLVSSIITATIGAVVVLAIAKLIR